TEARVAGKAWIRDSEVRNSLKEAIATVPDSSWKTATAPPPEIAGAEQKRRRVAQSSPMEVPPAEGAGTIPTGEMQGGAGRSGEKASAGEMAPTTLQDVEACLVLQGSQWAYLPPEHDRGPAPAAAPRPGGRESGGTPRASRWAPVPAPIEPEPPPPTPTQEDGRISIWLDSQRPPPPRRRVRPSRWDVPPLPRGPVEACRRTPSSPDAGDDPTTAEDVDSDSEDEREYIDIIEKETQIPAEHQATVESMLEKMKTLFPSETQGENLESARRAVESSFKRANEEYTIDTAVKAAGDFHFDQTALDRDKRDLERSGYDLEKMLAARRRQNSGSRLSARRVREALSPDNPERELLREMAQGGVRVSDVGSINLDWP
ncbi:hypothetical protein B484DRAFT_406737, partial [Ochromonadaceae sp. CCMP2298]